MAYFTSLWKARIIEKYKREYEDEKLISLLASNTEIPRKTSMMQRWRLYRRDTKSRIAGKLKQLFPEGSSVSNLYYYLRTDQTFSNFVLKRVVGFLGGVVLTYLCFVFFVFQLSISLIHATIMSSVIGVLLTLGLAFSNRIRCLVFLLIPQLFSRVGRYTLTCYALVLILTGPATNTFKNSEVLSESMACSQEQIKTSVRQINESMKKPFNAMKDTIKLMVATIKRLTATLDEIISRISVLVISIADVIQSSLTWLNSVGVICNKRFGTPYDYCIKAVNRGVLNCKKTFKGDLSWLCNASSAAKTACWTVRPYKSVCFIADYATTSFAATMKRRLRVFTNRINKMVSINIETKHTYTFSSNASDSPTQIAAGIVTELRNRADPLLTWLSWSSCVTSLFLLLIIFRAKYYQHMYETRSRFDNRYVTQELCELDFKRYREGRETILPLNRREKAKYIDVTSFHLVTTEKLYVTRSMVFMTITTFKLLIHIVADYSLYWVLMTMRKHGRFQTLLPPGPSNAGVQISGYGIMADFIRSIFDALTTPLVQKVPSPVTCLPNPYPPDLQRYSQIAVLIMLLWFFSLFEPYGLRLRHVIMGHYRPERAKTRAVWLYNHIMRTRGSFMKLARRKLHREYKYSDQENLTFRHWINSVLPCWYLRYIFGTLPKEPHCLLCNTLEEGNDSDTKLISCKAEKCSGVYCARCFCDIGHLCTICIKPEDYGDMSDISLEKGSSDDSSDKESDDDGDHSDDVLTLEKNSMQDDEREKLIKKSDTKKENTRRKTPKEHKNQAEDEISLISSDDEPQNIEMNSQCQNYLINYKTSLMNTVENKTKIILKDKIKKDNEFNNWYFKAYHQKHNNKKAELYNIEEYSKAYDSKNKKSNAIDKCNVKLKQRCRTKLKRTASHKWHRIFKTLYEKLHFRRFKIFQCSEHWSDCIYKFNIYHIKISARFFQVSKINAHSKKLSKFKYGSHKIPNYKSRNINNSMTQKSTIKQLFIAGCECRKCKNKDQKSKNKRNIDLNTLGNYKESHETKKEEDSRDINVRNKHKNTAKHKHSSNGVQKFCIFCSSCLQTSHTPSRDIAKDNKCWCLNEKANFKRRKKKPKENKSEIFNKNRMVKEEKVNARNYRLSSYLSDQSWIRQKFCKDPGKDKLQGMDMLCDLAKLRIAAADQQAKKGRLLKVFEKAFKINALNKCHCPSDVCICERKSNKNEKLNSETISPEADLARRINFYNSSGNHDFKTIGEIPEASTASPMEQNNLSTETTVLSNITSSSKKKSSKHSYSRIFDMDRLSTNIKSMKIKNIKLAISESFLHLRIKHPLPLMKELYATLLEASSKVKNGKNKDTRIYFKKTAEKGVTVFPIVKSCSCQFLDVTQTLEDRTTHMNKKDIRNLPGAPKSYDVRDAEVEVVVQTCTCATQYRKCKDKTCSCMTVDKDAKEAKELGDTAKIEDYSSNETESNVTLSTISLSEDTRTDTTLCSQVAIDYEVSPKCVKPKKNVIKAKVITKANQGTSTDRTQLCDVSTVTSDWWSPIVERKLGREHLGRGEMYDGTKQRKKSYKDKSVSTDGRVVTFMSRAQIIPTDTGDILSPSRYLLESQKYYNELFTSKFFPRVYPVNDDVNDKGLTDCKNNCSLKDSNRKERKTKRLARKTSPRLKISKSSIDKILLDKTTSRRHYMKSRS